MNQENMNNSPRNTINKKEFFKSIGVLLLVGAVIVISNSFYVVREGNQAVITQFGRPIGEAKQTAGLYFKLPFIQKVRLVERRIMNWDGDQNQVPTKDKKYIIIDTTARWRIVDPLLFIQTVGDETTANYRLNGIIESATRDTISSHNLVEAVRNTNLIIDEIKQRAEQKATDEAADIINQVEEEITGEIEPVFEGREKLSSKILERAHQEVTKLGINLIDVQLRRISYEKSVEAKVYERMISERQRIAEKIRSVGKGEQAKIEGKTSRDLLEIQSNAYRKVRDIQGKAEAEAIKIYADSIGKNTDFYEFLRTLEAYKKSIKPDTNFLTSSDSRFLKLLRDGE